MQLDAVTVLQRVALGACRIGGCGSPARRRDSLYAVIVLDGYIVGLQGKKMCGGIVLPASV